MIDARNEGVILERDPISGLKFGGEAGSCWVFNERLSEICWSLKFPRIRFPIIIDFITGRAKQRSPTFHGDTPYLIAFIKYHASPSIQERIDTVMATYTKLVWSPHRADKSGAGRSFDDKSRERRCGYF